MYSITLKKHVTLFGIYTEDEITSFDRLEKEWKASQPHYSFKQLIDIFPEAKVAARRSIKKGLSNCKLEMSLLGQWREAFAININNLHFKDQPEKIEWLRQEYKIRRAEIESRAKKLTFNLSLLNEKTPQKKGGIDERDIERAKEVPIQEVFPGKLRRAGKVLVACCPFHSEKTASFTVYKENRWWCYGACSTGGSVVDFVMKRDNCNFLSAVKTLIR